ncbi:MAG: NAD-dependent epimerase/dehydratase family protein [Candidatus Aminicenantes bacterium]|nr:NAD-dependent epimerase/dehydratase family protein [Candidatus Aminicenantes bacterium]
MSADSGAPNALVTGISSLVSGATGFLGGYLLARLRKKGFQVRALARKTSDVAGLVRAGCDIYEGDIMDRQSLLRAMVGQQLVFHTAGKVSDRGSRREFWQANVDGTANVIAACREAGVKRLIHLSSLTVLGLPRSGARVDEQTPPAAALRDPYSASKLAGERLVREAHGSSGLETVVIRPGVIWGPGDTTIMPRLIALLRRRRLVFIGRGDTRLRVAAAPPALSRYGVRLVACDSRYDIGKARRELAYRPTLTFRQGMEFLFAAATTEP